MSGINEALISIKRAVGAIGKDKYNKDQGFRFRGIDDIENALHHALIDAGVSVVPVVTEYQRFEGATKSGTATTTIIVTVAHHFTALDGSTLVAVTIGEGKDTGDKATAKAMTMARKTAVLQVFGIPTDEEDPEADSGDPDARLSPDQIEALNTEIERTGTEVGKLMKWATGRESEPNAGLTGFPPSKYEAALKMLKAKPAKGAA